MFEPIIVLFYLNILFYPNRRDSFLTTSLSKKKNLRMGDTGFRKRAKKLPPKICKWYPLNRLP